MGPIRTGHSYSAPDDILIFVTVGNISGDRSQKLGEILAQFLRFSPCVVANFNDRLRSTLV